MSCDRPCSRSSSRPKTQAGNILFLILLAVVLFAALASAVTSSLRGGGKSMSSENADLAASSIVNFLKQVDSALLRMQLIDDIKPENISFEYRNKRVDGISQTNYVNNRCSSDDCRVFSASGGGATPTTFERYSNQNA